MFWPSVFLSFISFRWQQHNSTELNWGNKKESWFDQNIRCPGLRIKRFFSTITWFKMKCNKTFNEKKEKKRKVKNRIVQQKCFCRGRWKKFNAFLSLVIILFYGKFLTYFFLIRRLPLQLQQTTAFFSIPSFKHFSLPLHFLSSSKALQKNNKKWKVDLRAEHLQMAFTKLKWIFKVRY